MSDVILGAKPLGFVWDTLDPFLFCVHHNDAYPAGDEKMAPKASLAGRDLGQDFAGKDGWNMYHGEVVPGFPAHPHRGFETVTIVREGFVDHSDSAGATARFGMGDVQWLTAGGGVVHSEMFPLREREKPNPMELFQIWLNLPAVDKKAPAHFTMFWHEKIPVRTVADAAGRKTVVTVIAGGYQDAAPLAPPPHSWASRAEADLAIWTLKLEPGATFTVPPAQKGTNRVLYLFVGNGVRIAGKAFDPKVGITVRPDAPVSIENGAQAAELLMLQGRPIGEPVAQQGPFVMNTNAEIQQAFADYRRTRFGGWPWPSPAPVHAREQGRFARHTDGRVENAG